MVTIGQRTLDVANLYAAGHPVLFIAKKLGITTSSVEKRLRSYKKFQSGDSKPSHTVDPIWTLENLKEGFDRFISEHGRLPTAYEIDDCDYLPSSRQIQRRFGGLTALRESLGFGKVSFNSGDNKSATLKVTSVRGADAEDKLEEILIQNFGSLFVHSERRFGAGRRRVDFVIYALKQTFAIDVFATNDTRTLVKNLDAKMPKYTDFPEDTTLYFLVWGDKISQNDIDELIKRSPKWSSYPNLRVVTLTTLLSIVSGYSPLSLPPGYKAL